MPLKVANLDWLNKVTLPDNPQFGVKLAQALKSIQQAHNNIELQTNTNSSAPQGPPPQINGLHVSAQNGHFQVAITDTNEIYRGVGYFLEHADNSNFHNSHVFPLGSTRNTNLFLGNATRYFRAYSAYGTGPASAPVYHGGAIPVAVAGGGNVGPPGFLASQGSGTGAQGQGLVGNGPVQYRSTSGVPPARG